MKKTELESYVKKSFNVTIKDFMKQRVESDGLFDREIANKLYVSIPTVRKLRKWYGIKRADPFFRQFERNHGPGAVRRFKDIVEDPSSSLADVGRYFGFTREYARQIYKKIYGVPYTGTYKKKILLRKSKADSLKFPSSRLMHIKKIKDKIATMGLDPAIVVEAKSYVLMTNNNLRVAVLRNSKLRQIRNKNYFPLNIVSKQMQDCDFFILYHFNNGDSTCYVIPNEIMPKKGSMIQVSSEDTDSKYARFKDAWHLLASINSYYSHGETR